MLATQAMPNNTNELDGSVTITGGTSKVRTGPLSPDLAQSIVSMRLTGLSISQIAKSLGTTRNTVRAHVKRAMVNQQAVQATLQAIIPDAVAAVHKCIKAGDGKLALQLLERMNALTSTTSKHSDTNLTVAINTLISTGKTSVPLPLAHPSGQEGEGDDLKLEGHGQNFPKLPSAKIISSVEEGEK